MSGLHMMLKGFGIDIKDVEKQMRDTVGDLKTLAENIDKKLDLILTKLDGEK